MSTNIHIRVVGEEAVPARGVTRAHRRPGKARLFLVAVLGAQAALSAGAAPSLAGPGSRPVTPPTSVEGDLVLGDDDSRELELAFPFQICGQSYKTVWVNSNGSLSFGAGDRRYVESVPDFLAGPPRVAAKWDDLNPATGGRVAYRSRVNSFVVSFEDVPDYYDTGSNTFTVTLHRGSNHVEVDYGEIIPGPDNDGIAGVSCGAGATIGNESEVDLSANRAVRRTGSQGAVYEAFTENDFDLSNQRLSFAP